MWGSPGLFPRSRTPRGNIGALCALTQPDQPLLGDARSQECPKEARPKQGFFPVKEQKSSSETSASSWEGAGRGHLVLEEHHWNLICFWEGLEWQRESLQARKWHFRMNSWGVKKPGEALQCWCKAPNAWWLAWCSCGFQTPSWISKESDRLSVIPGGWDCGGEGLEHPSFVFVLPSEQETPRVPLAGLARGSHRQFGEEVTDWERSLSPTSPQNNCEWSEWMLLIICRKCRVDMWPVGGVRKKKLRGSMASDGTASPQLFKRS